MGVNVVSGHDLFRGPTSAEDPAGLEPTTSRLHGGALCQLSYRSRRRYAARLVPANTAISVPDFRSGRLLASHKRFPLLDTTILRPP